MIDGDEADPQTGLGRGHVYRTVPWPGCSFGGVGAILMLRQVAASPEKHPGVNRC